MKYTKEEALAKISELVGNFKASERQLASEPEAQIENNYIRPLFEYLNWNTRNSGLAVADYEFVVQKTDRYGKRPDYILQLDGQHLLVVDAKQVKYDMHDPRWMNQVYAYAYSTQINPPSRKIDFALLTDFQEFVLLDCTLYARRPETVANFRVLDWTCEDYIAQFDTLWELFERDNMRQAMRARRTDSPLGLWARYLSPRKVKANRIPPDKSFLAIMDDNDSGWRVRLAKDMKKRNPQADSEVITAAVQLLINRLIFIKALSDREVEDDYLAQLNETVERSGLAELDTGWFEACRAIFTKLNRFYNGSIFEPRPELEAVQVGNRTVRDVLHDLLPENSQYHFAILPVEILGTIYERFLGRVVHATDKRVKIITKPELSKAIRKASGIYYTPQYIVDYIVQNTVGTLLERCRSPRDVERLRILDPACGSGSFLVAAYDTLIRWHVRYYSNRDLGAKDRGFAYHDGSNGVRLSARLKRQILLNNIFGVDLDEQAVEVTRFSLSLKALEDIRPAELTEERNLFQQTILPNLSGNIKCGNSLIGNGLSLFLMEERLAIKTFDWKRHFPEIMSAGGFDAVIGNPPYLNIDDTWGKKDPRLAALKAYYPHIYNDKTDILFYFLGKALELGKGRVGMIVSRAFLEAYKADKLRHYLVSNSAITKIIDFRNFLVFPGVGITTCIIILEPGKPPGPIEVFKMARNDLPSLELSAVLDDPKVFEHIQSNQASLNSSPWVFASAGIAKLNSKVDAAGEPLGQILIIGQGMQTGRNEVFGGRSQEEVLKWRMKPGTYYKRASNSDIQRYFIRDRGEFIIYPQSARAFDALPAGVKKHLLAAAAELKGRAAHKRGDCEWWKFTWPLHAEYYERKRILSPYLAGSNRFALDEKGDFLSLTDTIVLFDNDQSESLLYLLGLLNSRLLTFRFKSIGKLKSGGIYEYFWNSVSRLPIRRINFSDPVDQQRHDRMVELVGTMMELQRLMGTAATQGRQQAVQRQIEAGDREIDALVYELYGLDAEEIGIVERS